jgi:SAM-dependent methyltransferase
MRLAERGFEVEGIDHSQAMLDIAQEKVRARGFEDRVRLRTGDVRALPFDDASFDLVTCTGVLHHLPASPSPVVRATVHCGLGRGMCVRAFRSGRRPLRAACPIPSARRSDSKSPTTTRVRSTRSTSPMFCGTSVWKPS